MQLDQLKRREFITLVAWPSFGVTYYKLTGHKILFVPSAIGQFDCLPPSRHDLNPRFRIEEARLRAISARLNPPHMIGFMESMN
jgi:hypothetical protein